MFDTKRRGRRICGSLLLVSAMAVSLWSPLSTRAGTSNSLPERSWRWSPPEVSGWAAETFKPADDVARSMGTDAYLVVHHGAIVHQFGDVSKPMNQFSGRKSVLSLLFGIAQDRTATDLNTTLAELGIDDTSTLTEVEKTATVRQLLQTRDTEYVYEQASRYPAYVMRVSARDTARIGLLMARGGRWQDQQVVSRQWVDESTASYSDTSPGVGYGYLWWVGKMVGTSDRSSQAPCSRRAVTSASI
ncbi:MAG: hypothetical protein Q7T69_12510 [Rhodoferax sp.]|nr:hypothetical protein [Rhodoferax sp.]